MINRLLFLFGNVSSGLRAGCVEVREVGCGVVGADFWKLLIPYAFWNSFTHAEAYPDGFYMGIIELGNNTETKRLIDETKDFANLIVISNMQTIRDKTVRLIKVN